ICVSSRVCSVIFVSYLLIYASSKICYCLCLIFFFQAEDGIRDRNVTGVQTCALPIYSVCRFISLWRPAHDRGGLALGGTQGPKRSEERRVGKECRYRWWRCRDRKKEINVRKELLIKSSTEDTQRYNHSISTRVHTCDE